MDEVIEWVDGVWLSPDGASQHYTVGAPDAPTPAPAVAVAAPASVWARVPVAAWAVPFLVASSGALAHLAGR